MDLSTTLKHSLQTGASLRIDTTSTLRPSTWLERFCSSSVDTEVEKRLLEIAQKSLDDLPTLSILEKYAAKFKLRSLENYTYAAKVAELFTIPLSSLVDETGCAVNDHLSLIRKNHFHRVIPSVDPENVQTAWLSVDDTLYIRSEEGVSFLEDDTKIKSILSKISDTHPHAAGLNRILEIRQMFKSLGEICSTSQTVLESLTEDQDTLASDDEVSASPESDRGTDSPKSLALTIEDVETPTLDDVSRLNEELFSADIPTFKQILEIRQKVDSLKERLDDEFSHLLEHYTPLYSYLRVEDLPKTASSTIDTVCYLAHGITSHAVNTFEKLPDSHRSDSSFERYTFTVVTRLPAYAVEKNFFRRIWMIISRLFDISSHGHSWIEISRPTERGQYTSSVGYYPHIITNRRRLETPEHQKFVPIPQNHLLREEFEVSEEHYHKAKLYIEEVAKMLSNRDKRLGDTPQTPGLSEKQIEDIKFIFDHAMKSTCLGFANALRLKVTGICCDDRSLRRHLFPRWLTNKLSSIFDPIARRLNVGLINALSIFVLAELPVYRAPSES